MFYPSTFLLVIWYLGREEYSNRLMWTIKVDEERRDVIKLVLYPQKKMFFRHSIWISVIVSIIIFSLLVFFSVLLSEKKRRKERTGLCNILFNTRSLQMQQHITIHFFSFVRDCCCHQIGKKICTYRHGNHDPTKMIVMWWYECVCEHMKWDVPWNSGRADELQYVRCIITWTACTESDATTSPATAFQSFLKPDHDVITYQSLWRKERTGSSSGEKALPEDERFSFNFHAPTWYANTKMMVMVNLH